MQLLFLANYMDFSHSQNENYFFFVFLKIEKDKKDLFHVHSSMWNSLSHSCSEFRVFDLFGDFIFSSSYLFFGYYKHHFWLPPSNLVLDTHVMVSVFSFSDQTCSSHELFCTKCEHCDGRCLHCYTTWIWYSLPFTAVFLGCSSSPASLGEMDFKDYSFTVHFLLCNSLFGAVMT